MDLSPAQLDARDSPAMATGMLDQQFAAAVGSLRVTEMGTDAVAPLLYWLLRMGRPQRVVEVGMGYTTPFIARALQDNREAIRREKALLEASRPVPLARPAFYDEPHEGQLVCIDHMGDPTSSAARAWKVLEQLDLTDRCTVIEADLRAAQEPVHDRLGGIDFAWVDTWDTVAFIDGYWDLVNPAGGTIAIHYLMTYPEGRAVLNYIESLREVDGGRLELINVLEPHKAAQNSLTLVRRVRDYQDPDLRTSTE